MAVPGNRSGHGFIVKPYIATIVCSLCLFTGMSPCFGSDGRPFMAQRSVLSRNMPQLSQDSNHDNTPVMNKKITIKIGHTTFIATLQDNASAKAFRNLLPLTAKMNEHAGNEKFYNLAKPLPAEAVRPEIIQAGDLMLWGNNCLVLFYKTFSSPYRYTRIGKIDDPADLQKTVGHDSVTVTFEQSSI